MDAAPRTVMADTSTDLKPKLSPTRPASGDAGRETKGTAILITLTPSKVRPKLSACKLRYG